MSESFDEHKPLWNRVTRAGDNTATRLEVDMASERVELGGGFWMRANNRVVVREWTAFEANLYLRLDDGRLVADRLEVWRSQDGPPITSETIREIPVASLVRYGREAIFIDRPDQDAEVADLLRQGQEQGKPTIVMRSYSEFAAWPRLEDRQYVDEHGLDDRTLEIVARIYRVAYMIGAGPTKTVESALGLTRSTAGRWVGLARKRGLLGQTTPGKAGA